MTSLLARLRQAPAGQLALVIILAATFLRLWYITRMGLVADEAYYWLWSKHLAASRQGTGDRLDDRAGDETVREHAFWDPLFCRHIQQRGRIAHMFCQTRPT